MISAMSTMVMTMPLKVVNPYRNYEEGYGIVVRINGQTVEATFLKCVDSKTVRVAVDVDVKDVDF